MMTNSVFSVLDILSSDLSWALAIFDIDPVVQEIICTIIMYTPVRIKHKTNLNFKFKF